MKIGILGSGGVATTLAKGFDEMGHKVKLGTRDAAKLAAFQADNPSVAVGSMEDCAAFGDCLVLAVNGLAATAVVDGLGAAALAGKVVLDATNPVAAVAPDGGVLRYFTSDDQSLMEQLQALAPEACFVKAFSCVGQGFMIKPQLPGGPPTMFICGNDLAAKQVAQELLTECGWESEDMGDVRAARAIEPLAKLWCLPGMLHGKWTHAFKLLKL